jgi:hypothetical protein
MVEAQYFPNIFIPMEDATPAEPELVEKWTDVIESETVGEPVLAEILESTETPLDVKVEAPKVVENKAPTKRGRPKKIPFGIKG